MAERVDQRHRPEVGLRRSLEEQFVAELLRRLLRGPAFREWEIGEFIEVGLLSERLRCKAAHRQNANERGGEEV